MTAIAHARPADTEGDPLPALMDRGLLAVAAAWSNLSDTDRVTILNIIRQSQQSPAAPS